MTEQRRRKPIVVFSVVSDLVSVVIFTALGRGAHDEELTPAGFLGTLWPFLVGMVVAWVVMRMWRDTVHWWRTAGLVAITVVVGQVLRVLVAQDTTHWTFVVVSVLALGVLLFGWRLVDQFVRPRMSPDQE